MRQYRRLSGVLITLAFLSSFDKICNAQASIGASVQNGKTAIVFYQSEQAHLSFDEALGNCKNLPDGELLHGIDDTSQKLIADQLRKWSQDVDENLKWKAGYWAGASGTSQWNWFWSDGQYLSATNGNPGQYANWAANEPSCSYEPQCYLRISAQDSVDGDKDTLGKWFASKSPSPDSWGSHLCQMKNPCYPSPCPSDKTCVLDGITYQCRSPDPCDDFPCQNNGTCNSMDGSYICNCLPGFSGQDCKTDPCSSSPCLNNGSCSFEEDFFSCSCQPGYSGETCRNDPCYENLCVNGDCQVNGSEYICNCEEGFTGMLCDSGDSSSDPCISEPCENGATCRTNSEGYECLCVEGFQGTNCQTEAGDSGSDPCESKPCKNGASCRNTSQGYECLCIQGYEGIDCETETAFAASVENQAQLVVFYQSEAEPMTFDRARSNCRALNGGDLLVITDSTTQQLVTEQLAKWSHNVDTSLELKASYLVGASGKGESNWTWVNGQAFDQVSNPHQVNGEPFKQKLNDPQSFANWLSGQPDCGAGVTCYMRVVAQDLVIGGDAGTSESALGKWIDSDPNEADEWGSYICQMANPCQPQPCPANQLCVIDGTTYVCENTGDSDIWRWVIVGLGVLLLLLLIVGTAVYCTRKHKKKRPSRKRGNNNGVFHNDAVYEAMNEGVSPYAIPVQIILTRYRELIKDDCIKLRKQFNKELTAAGMLVQSTTVAASKRENQRKNRFVKILPYDKTRVVLTFQNKDYINASLVNGSRSKCSFIATQAPMSNTMGDFWEMVWEQKSRVIVMLNNLTDDANGNSCKTCWPDLNGTCQYGSVNVRTKTEKHYVGYVVRKLEICLQTDVMYTSVMKTVTHFQFLDWPDRGIPMSTSTLFRLRNHVAVEAESLKVKAPVVVHCKDGSGPTGTFIAFDRLLNEMNETSSVNVFECVMDLRKQRTGMVQSEEEYVFLHKLLAEAYTLGDTDTKISDIQRKVTVMNRISVGQNKYELEFRKLDLIQPLNDSQEVAKRSENIGKNLTSHVLPYDFTLVQLPSVAPGRHPAYYNASFVEISSVPVTTIAAQAPTYETLVEFWHVVWHHRVRNIIMLCREEENKMCITYWPQNIGQSATFGDITVTLVGEKGRHLVERSFALSSKDKRLTVTQLQLKTWSEKIDQGFLQLVQHVNENHSVCEGPLLVHCIDGASRTGTFLGALEVLNRKEEEGMVDIPRTIKDLRDWRPGMVGNMRQYMFLYDVAKRNTSTYSAQEMDAY